MGKHRTTDLDLARDELFSHVNRCGVLQAAPEQQEAWMSESIAYIAERFPSLSPTELAELQEIGMRFCQPVIPHGKQHTALTMDEEQEAERGEMAGAV